MTHLSGVFVGIYIYIFICAVFCLPYMHFSVFARSWVFVCFCLFLQVIGFSNRKFEAENMPNLMRKILRITISLEKHPPEGHLVTDSLFCTVLGWVENVKTREILRFLNIGTGVKLEACTTLFHIGAFYGTTLWYAMWVYARRCYFIFEPIFNILLCLYCIMYTLYCTDIGLFFNIFQIFLWLMLWIFLTCFFYTNFSHRILTKNRLRTMFFFKTINFIIFIVNIPLKVDPY
jgi:hypothetical protein